mgnify:CR=1 FL=1
MSERTCATCRHVLPAGKPAPNGRRYGVECCTHPKVRNQAGIYATVLARRPDEKCGPDARGWKPIAKETTR